MTTPRRRAGEIPRPMITVLHPRGCDPALVRQLCAGIEEEGVPHEVHVLDEIPDPPTCAEEAARRSLLGVAVALGDSGGGAVAVESLPAGHPALLAQAPLDASGARRLGHNTARIVTRLPFVR